MTVLVSIASDARGMRAGADGGWEPTPVIVCVRCGHEESEGVWFAASSDDAGVDTGEVERALAEHRRAGGAALGRLDFPVYALETARRALIGLLPGPGELPDASPPALTVLLAAHQRAQVGLALRAEPVHVALRSVDPRDVAGD